MTIDDFTEGHELEIEESNSIGLNGPVELEAKTPERIELEIEIDGKTIVASPPKMKILRMAVKYRTMNLEDEELFNTDKGIDLIYELLKVIFADKNLELTNEVLDESPLTNAFSLANVIDWLNQFFNSKNYQQATEINTMRAKQKSGQ